MRPPRDLSVTGTGNVCSALGQEPPARTQTLSLKLALGFSDKARTKQPARPDSEETLPGIPLGPSNFQLPTASFQLPTSFSLGFLDGLCHYCVLCRARSFGPSLLFPPACTFACTFAFANRPRAVPAGAGYSRIQILRPRPAEAILAGMPRMHTHTQMHTRVPDVIVMRTLLPGFSPVGRSEALALAPGVGVGAGLIAYGQLAVIKPSAFQRQSEYTYSKLFHQRYGRDRVLSHRGAVCSGDCRCPRCPMVLPDDAPVDGGACSVEHFGAVGD